ncbi:MAG: MFS transporter [Acidimicrobiales bacterium]
MDARDDSLGSAMAPVEMRGLAFANVSTMLVLTGAIASLYGPLLITIAKTFQLSLPQAGVVVSVHFVGALAGVPVGWITMKHLKGSAVVGLTLACFAFGTLDVALVSSWALFLAGVFVVGMGFGGLDYTLNTLLVRTALAGRARRLSVANAGYGVGAVLGPLLVVLVQPRNYPILFGGAAALAVLLSTMNRGIIAPPPTLADRQHELKTLHLNRRSILVTFIIAYVLYVAAESSASGWIAPQLHREGHGASLGSLITGGFWLGLALGRIVGGLLHRRFADRALVLASLATAIFCAGLALNVPAAPFVYPILGLALASVYPMGLVWYTTLCPHDRDGLSLIIFFMMAGGVLGPGAESLMVSLFGIHAVPVVIMTLLVSDLIAFASARRFRTNVTRPS